MYMHVIEHHTPLKNLLHVPYYLTTDCHSSMMNVTSRLAIRIRHIPDFEFDWSDKTPQRSRQSITIEDVSPSQSDARVLKQRAIQFIMEFLVKTFSNLQDLEEFIPPVEPIHPVQKSEVVPMKLLLKDEKYKTETIDILAQLYSDAALSGDHQVLTTQVPMHPHNPILIDTMLTLRCTHVYCIYLYKHMCTHTWNRAMNQ